MRLLLASSLALTLSTALAAPAFAEWPTTPLELTFMNGHSQRLHPDASGGSWGSFMVSTSFTVRHRFRQNPDGSLASFSDTGPSSAGGSYMYDEEMPDDVGGLYRAFDGGNLKLFHYQSSGPDAGWPSGGLAVLTGNLGTPVLAPDETGGIYVAMGNFTNVIVKHVLSNGTLATGWPAGGRVLAAGSAYDQGFCALQPDGAGGVFVLRTVISEATVKLVRLTSSNTFASGWTSSGVDLGSYDESNGYPKYLQPIASGSNHWIAVWTTVQGASGNIFVERFDGDGNLDPNWNAGNGIQLGPTSPSTPVAAMQVVSDGIDGLWAVWQEPDVIRGSHVTVDGVVDHDGIALTPAGVTPSFASPQSLVPGRSRGVILTWQNQVGPTSYAIFARWFAPDGSPEPNQPDNGFAFGDTGFGLSLCAVMSDGSDGLDVVYGYPGVDAVRLPFPQAPAGVELPRATRVLSLGAPSPNPARDEIDVRFTLAGSGSASLDLVDLAGRRVRGLAVEGTGAQSARFDHLSELPAGVYFVRLAQGNLHRMTRAVVVH
jgi:hypothetical protein